MTIIALTRRPVKPTRHTVRPAAPFGSGVVAPEKPALSSPIDTRDLPAIDGTGLTENERRRILGAENRAKHAYATDCPDASMTEIVTVGRKAATDELRRALADRPAAPAPVAPVVKASQPVPDAPLSRRQSSSSSASLADRLWWAQVSNQNTRNYSVLIPAPAPIRGGAPVSPWDRRAAESRAMDCMERGLIPSDAADLIASTSLVGHPA